MITGPRSAAGRAPAPAVVAFYSLMGGVGGTMAVANCAALLAAAGRRVLVVDWDLAAPRLHDYLRPFTAGVPAPGDGGLIELVRRFAGTAPEAGPLSLSGHLVPLRMAGLGPPGGVDFLPPMGLGDLVHLSTLWRGWDERPPGTDLAEFAVALRRALAATAYDHVLVDVPYGASDAARAAIERLADVLVAGFRLAADGIDRTADLARGIRDGAPGTRVVPVLMRVDPELGRGPANRNPEQERLLERTRERFGWLVGDRPGYWGRMRVPDSPDYERGERLAVLTAPERGDGGLAGAYRRLVAEFTGGGVPAGVRVPAETRAAYERDLAELTAETRAASACVLAAPRERAWADWIGFELRRTGVPVCAPPEPGGTVEARVLLVVGASRPGAGEPPWAGVRVPSECQVIALRTAHHSEFPGLRVTREINMRWHGEASARGTLRELFGVSGGEPAGDGFGAGFRPRFPRGPVEVRYLPPPNPAFVGRRRELDALRDRLLSPEGGPAPYVLCGEPGTGKSQIALEYAERFATDYDQVWWIPAQSEQDVRATLAKVARHLLAEDRGDRGDVPGGGQEDLGGDLAGAALEMLGDPGRAVTWLLVYDNAGALADIAHLLPWQGAHGHVIVTARHAGPAGDTAGEAAAAEPGPFTFAESRELFRRVVPALAPDQADGLAALAEDLPLAVALVAAWIATDNRRRQGGAELPRPGDDLPDVPETSLRERGAVENSVAAFRDGFAERRRLAAAAVPGEPGTAEAADGNALDAARTVLDMALETLAVGRNGRAVRRLVELAAFLSPDGVSRRLLYSPAMLDALRAADPGFTDSTVLDALLVRTSRFGLAVVDHVRDGQVLMHRLVQRLIREGLGAHAGERRAEMLRVLAAYCPPDGEVDQDYHRERFAELQRHLEPSGALDGTDAAVRRWLAVQVRFLRRADDPGSVRAGRALAERLWARWRARHRRDDPLLVRLQIDLALLLRPDEPGRAAELFTAALAHQRRDLGLHHPATLMTARGLGALLWTDGAFGEAYEEDLSTLGLLRRVFGGGHPMTMEAAGNLVLSEMLTGRLREALEREQALQDAAVRSLGEHHLRVLASRTVVGVIMRELGEYEESEAALASAADVLEERFPADEQNLLRAQRELALTRLRLPGADVPAARKVIAEVLARYRRTYGETAYETVACRVSEAVAAHAAGEDDLAAEIAADCRDRLRERFRDDHPFVFAVQSNLAVYTRADRLDEAIAVSGEALEGLMAALDDGGHPYLMLAHLNHGGLLADAARIDPGRLAEAARLLEFARDGYHALFGADHPATAAARENLREVRARLAGAGGAPRRAHRRFIEWTAPLI
ncbi:FxSxx-COOH system tetratricopeptide repeat protein [Actinomadura roseirufa]|uniref:FxSxx-COOH system tetratricopeptide repeat protein n=1 Tax=Actinomadura roseirufa TaxID=2094049 RepID=UPI001040F8C6|nr:FxSxx-COOH system tetratricopeptide repeat protein [Actinomadura roseirufa]